MPVLTTTNAPGFYSTTGTALTMTAGNVGGDEFAAKSDLILVAHNTGGSTYTITITSVADPVTGRTGNVSAQNIAAGEIRIFRLTNIGWRAADGNIDITVSNAAVRVGIINL